MDISHMCRVCMDFKSTTKNLFETKIKNDDLPLNKVFTFVTSINICMNDGFPMEVCSLCISRLLESFKFKRQAEEANEEFKRQLHVHFFKEQIETPLSSETSHIQEQESDKTDEVNETNHINDLEMIPCIEETLDCEDGVQFLTGIKPPIFKEYLAVKKTKHKCQVCAREFSRKSNLVDHLRLHANLKLFQCKSCDKSFVQIANYRTHMRIHTNERPFQCQICNKNYNQSSTLKIHLRSHTDERNYRCEECAKSFTNSSDLKKHNRVHNPDMQFTCEFCGKLFAQKVNMLSHIRRVHTLESKKFEK